MDWDDEEQSAKRKDLKANCPTSSRQMKMETTKDVHQPDHWLISPVGFGQRALIVSQPKLVRRLFERNCWGDWYKLSKSISNGDIDWERPEEVNEIKRFIKVK